MVYGLQEIPACYGDVDGDWSRGSGIDGTSANLGTGPSTELGTGPWTGLRTGSSSERAASSARAGGAGASCAVTRPIPSSSSCRAD